MSDSESEAECRNCYKRLKQVATKLWNENQELKTKMKENETKMKENEDMRKKHYELCFELVKSNAKLRRENADLRNIISQITEKRKKEIRTVSEESKKLQAEIKILNATKRKQ